MSVFSRDIQLSLGNIDSNVSSLVVRHLVTHPCRFELNGSGSCSGLGEGLPKIMLHHAPYALGGIDPSGALFTEANIDLFFQLIAVSQYTRGRLLPAGSRATPWSAKPKQCLSTNSIFLGFVDEADGGVEDVPEFNSACSGSAGEEEWWFGDAQDVLPLSLSGGAVAQFAFVGFGEHGDEFDAELLHVGCKVEVELLRFEAAIKERDYGLELGRLVR